MPERLGFDKVIGQELAKRVLVRAVRENHPSHAYLFLGLESTGKLTTALEFAKALNCDSFDTAQDSWDGNACGKCATCRTIEHGNFPDIRVWYPGSTTGRDTSIKQMHEMREDAVFQPIRGRWKVNIIEQGDTLNEEAANCILKLVEEPPSYLVNILIYRNAAAVLPTIRSRCQLLRFTQVGTDELAARLVEEHAVEPDQARFLATYSQGRPGAAIGLIGNTEFFERRETVIVTASAASSGKPWHALALAEALRPGGGREEAEETDSGEEDDAAEEAASKQKKQGKRRSQREVTLESLDMLLTWYRDLLAAKLRGEDAPVINCDRLEEAVRQAERYPSPKALEKAIEFILQTRRGVLGNANPQIATEALMVRLAW